MALRNLWVVNKDKKHWKKSKNIRKLIAAINMTLGGF